MREIKFRGKDLGGNWRHGDLIAMDCMTPSIMDERGDRIPVQADTVGQYTGLKDRDGRDIYDGDILAYNHPIDRKERRFYAVGWNLGSWCVKNITDGYDPWSLKVVEFEGQPIISCPYILDNSAICGNRWDAPEMLKP